MNGIRLFNYIACFRLHFTSHHSKFETSDMVQWLILLCTADREDQLHLKGTFLEANQKASVAVAPLIFIALHDTDYEQAVLDGAKNILSLLIKPVTPCQ